MPAVMPAIVVRQRKSFRRKDGTWVYFEGNVHTGWRTTGLGCRITECCTTRRFVLTYAIEHRLNNYVLLVDSMPDHSC